jgi:hypothetical protein
MMEQLVRQSCASRTSDAAVLRSGCAAAIGERVRRRHWRVRATVADRVAVATGNAMWGKGDPFPHVT